MSSTAEKKTGSTESLVLGFSMFIMGGCGLAYEYTFSRVASDLLGNSTQQWAIIIGVMLFFMGVGADLQKYLKEHRLVDKLILSEIALGLFGGFGPITMLYAYGSFPFHYILVQYFFISAVGLLIGLEIPLITRINEAYSLNLRVNLGRILKMDYIGSLCGALFWIFVLPRFFTMVQTAFVLSFITVGVAGIALIYFRSLIHHFVPLVTLVALGLSTLGYSFYMAQNWTSFTEQKLFRDRIIFSQTSKYQHIVLTQSTSREISCYINGRLQFNSADEYIYHENLVHPAMMIAPRRRNILILGGGDGLALREVLKYPDVDSVTLVDIDPVMTQLASKNPYFVQLNKNSLASARLTVVKNNALADAGVEKMRMPNQKSRNKSIAEEVAQVSILNLDAVKFVQQISGKYDVIIMDFPDPNALELAKLYAQHFYVMVSNRLSVDGVLVQQSTSPVGAREAYLCIGRTMKSAGLVVIPYHDNVPSFGEWGWWIGGHEKHYPGDEIAKAISNLNEMLVPTRYLTPALIQTSLVFGKEQLYSEYNDISTINSARVYDYYIKGWKNNL